MYFYTISTDYVIITGMSHDMEQNQHQKYNQQLSHFGSLDTIFIITKRSLEGT